MKNNIIALSEHAGQVLKRKIKGTVNKMSDLPEILGMSQQNINYHLRKEKLDPVFYKLVKSKLKIDLSDNENENLGPRLEAKPLHLSADPNDFDNDGSKFEELPDGTYRMRVPVIPYKAFAGYLRGFQDREYYEDLEYISIDVFKQHRGHYLAWEVVGDSMTTLEPDNFRKSIFNGVKVVGRELSKPQWRYKLHTHSYEAWVIVHKTEGILIKQIIDQDIEKGLITIHSLNPDKETYPDQVLKLDDIEQIFNVVKKIDE